jgi:hypothetical protein
VPQAKPGRPTKARELYLAKDPFLKALQDACHVADGAEGLPASERERQVEDAFFRAAVALEAFLSDWIARCLHLDTSRLAARARGEAVKHIANELSGAWTPENQILARTLADYRPTASIRMTLPKGVAVQKARRLLGVEDTNRSFATAAEFKEWVGRYLADPKAGAASSLGAADDAVLDATIAIRNVVAHRSRRSEERLAQALRSTALPNALRVQQRVTAAGVGRYLRVERGGRPRFKHYFERLANVANTLAPYRGRPRTICP